MPFSFSLPVLDSSQSSRGRFQIRLLAPSLAYLTRMGRGRTQVSGGLLFCRALRESRLFKYA